MSDKDKDTKDDLELRKALSDAYAFVAGSQAVAEISEFTVEKAHEQFIERIQGTGNSLRPNVLRQIDQTVSKILSSIDTLQKS